MLEFPRAMTLSEGDRLGPYEILGLLGAGGMGEVYKARDVRLQRNLALKVLHPELARDVDRLRRFEQEARAAGALNHPNIVVVYDVNAVGETPFIACELLEGQSLQHLLAEGPLAPRKAYDVAVQLAKGLAAAHGLGIVHRDLKPANIFVARDGLVKILDFGLARDTAKALAVSQSSSTLTMAGAILGTIGYMSPEQVRGEPADARSDVFSFGTLLYEMLTGEAPFNERSSAETMAAILHKEPAALTGLEKKLPPALEAIVRRCLEKDPDARFQSGRDLFFTLEAISGSESEVPALPPARKMRRIRKSWLKFAAGVLLGAALGGVAAWQLLPRRAVVSTVLRQLTHSGKDSSPAVSPDGHTIAFTSDRDGTPRIWLKQLSGGAEIPLTTGPDDYARFSPNGSSLLFVRRNGRGTDLYRTGVLREEARKIADDVANADWSPDGKLIAFVRKVYRGNSVDTLLATTTPEGTEPTELVWLRGEDLHQPRWSPDGSELLLAPTSLQIGTMRNIVIVDVRTRGVRRLKVPREGFNISALAWNLSGDEVLYSLAETAVGQIVSGSFGSSAHFYRHDIRSGEFERIFWSASGGQLINVAGPGKLIFDVCSGRENLIEVPLDGGRTKRFLTHGSTTDRQPTYSPAGDTVVFSSNRNGNLDLWMISRDHGVVRQITDDPAEDWDPVLVEGGKRLLWSSNRNGGFEIWIASADGTGARQISNDGGDAQNPSMTPDGQWVVYTSGNPGKQGIWRVRPDGTQAQRIAEGYMTLPEMSPDGQYVVYTVVQKDAAIVRAMRMPDGAAAPFEIVLPFGNSRVGSMFGRARWMPGGKRIAFVGQDDRGALGIWVQDFAPGTDTTATRRALGGFDGEGATESFGISPDGKRMTIAIWEQAFSVYLADRVPGIGSAKRRWWR
jgi:serine/threonine protein kinase